MKKALTTCLLAAFVLANVTAAEYYVSKETGKNGNAGTKDAPFKNIEKAAEQAQPGDKLYVAEGNYYGVRDKGFIMIKVPVEIYGGYSKDFSQRDVLKYRTLIMPPASSNGTGRANRLVEFAINGPAGSKMVLDGLIVDKGDSNGYHATKGKPAGVETGMLILPPGQGENGSEKKVITTEKPLVGGTINNCDFLVQNCVFLNAPNFAIQMGGSGNWKIINNVFIANAMSACQIAGMMNTPTAIRLEFAYNTVLFTWPRTHSFEDMGYGFRVMTKVEVNLHNNIIGLSSLSAIDRCYIDSPASMENGRKVLVDNNRFFMNKQADVTLPGLGTFEYVWVKDFEDVDRFNSAEGNEELKDVAPLKNVLNKAYLAGFLNAAYKEKTDYDPNSLANEFRRAMGMNQTMTVQTDVSMFANKYPQNDAVKLFGAVKGFGAQAIK
ncbi:right-handed parallel beta-helix repeat-containing protein [Treponema vincentii]|uniref:right-handed parallel beta-helix repeat-containing protein n=1 Tax=Treponema vincentii TaxID=69710 RepID=UPI0035F5BFC8